MKIYRIYTLFFSLSILCLADEPAEVWMPDPNLRQAVRESIGLPHSVPLTKENVLWLERLEAENRGIHSLQGLAFAINVLDLNLAKNPITDISPLRPLIKVTGLNLYDVNISDISPLKNLTRLTVLLLDNSQITDISALSNLTNLVDLLISNCNITDISPLANLTKLKILYLSYNNIVDISPLTDLIHLERLHLSSNNIVDVSPLAGLIHLKSLHLLGNPIGDYSPIAGLVNIEDLRIDQRCEIPPLGIPGIERIQKRTYPSVALPGSSYVAEEEPVRWFTDAYPQDEVWTEHYARHDITYFADPEGYAVTWEHKHRGLAIHLHGHLPSARAAYERYNKHNPHFIYLTNGNFNISLDSDFFPPNSDFWLRDTDGNIMQTGTPWDEFQIDFLNPDVQQLLIDRHIGIANCGFFQGIFFDNFAHNNTRGVGIENYRATDEEIIEATTNILRGIREEAREDFLILVNGGRSKLTRYTEWVNGSYMETGRDHPGGYTYKGLIEIEDFLLWNEKNLRQPTINVLEGHGVFEPFRSPNNLRWMRLFTTMALTHSDGYVIYRVPKEIDGYLQHVHIWYDFWDADMGRPVGGDESKGVLYQTPKGSIIEGVPIEGLFIREFTNGWAVYNRSGKTRRVYLPEKATGWESGIGPQHWHEIPDLDGEMYLKVVREQPRLLVPADVNRDGVVNVLDLVVVSNAFGEAAPDLNGDGVVNVLDLVIVSTAFGSN